MNPFLTLGLALGSLTVLTAMFGMFLSWQFSRESKRELKEFIAHTSELSRRDYRKFLETSRRELKETLKQMDAHIAMVLERVDKNPG